MENSLALASSALALSAGGRLAPRDAKRLRATATGSVHPLVYLAEQKLADEALVNSRAVQEKILGQIDTAVIREIAMGEGMRTLRLSGASRVARGGETTIEEVMRVAPMPDN